MIDRFRLIDVDSVEEIAQIDLDFVPRWMIHEEISELSGETLSQIR
jgi:hypothetical protein